MLSLITNTTAISPIETQNLILERKNLINVCKLVIKDLIDTSLFTDRCSLENESNELKHFFIVLENIFNHGFKGRRGFSLSTYKKGDLSYVLDILSSKSIDSNDTIKSVKDMTEIKTSLGKLRAWFKLSMIQKKLPDHFSLLIAQKDSLQDIYENEALLLSDEATVIAGLLVGLNVIDCNLCLKMSDDDYDQPLHTINYSLYLRERLPTVSEPYQEYEAEKKDEENKLSKALDQNNYLEELNKRSKITIDQLQQKIQSLEKVNSETNTELSKAKNEIIELNNVIEALKKEKEDNDVEYQKRINSTVQDIILERETFQSSKTGLDNMCVELQIKLHNETKLRTNAEKDLETQNSMRNELEAAKKLMEISLIEKQDLLTRMKEQLDQIKSSNFKTSDALNKTEAELRNKTSELDRVTKQLNELNKSHNELKSKYDSLNAEKVHVQENYVKVNEQLSDINRKKNELEHDLKSEKSFRLELEEGLDNEKHKVEVISNENSTLKEIKKQPNLENIMQEFMSTEYERLRIEHTKLKSKVEEQERTLEEMGFQLERSRLRMEDFREVTKQIQDFEWEKDHEVTHCKLCTKEFNVARRKHHCRRCGGIYCNECSDNKMPLPSSSKPVRVCDTCHTVILQQSVATK